MELISRCSKKTFMTLGGTAHPSSMFFPSPILPLMSLQLQGRGAQKSLINRVLSGQKRPTNYSQAGSGDTPFSVGFQAPRLS